MPAWLIDLFGSQRIQNGFLFISLAPLPFWVALIISPHRRWLPWLTSPFVIPPLLSLIYLYMVWNLVDLGAPPPPDVAAKSVRGYFRHPLVFLVLWAHLQVANIFVASVIREDGVRSRRRVRFELALCWLFAPAAVVIYAARRILFPADRPRNTP
jgi:hypothetical protein